MSVVYSESSPFVSVIFPAYNEEARLPPTLERTVDFLSHQPYASEVIVVENGSTDQTVAVVKQFITQHQLAGTAIIEGQERAKVQQGQVTVRLLQSAKGKGAAVRLGMLNAKGEYLVMSDADLSVPIEDLPDFLPPTLIAGSFDVAIASREVAGAVRHGEPEYRHLMGRVFNFLVRVIAVPDIQDTQCGFKCFTREAARFLFPLQQIAGWGFDAEVLHIASLHNLRMVEIPVNWYYGENSRVEPIRDTISMVNELMKVRIYGRRGFYVTKQAFVGTSGSSAKEGSTL